MKYDIKSLTAERLREYKKNRQWLITFLCLAVTVVLGTLAALKLYGQAMTHQVKVLKCGFEVHEHTEECYKEGAEKELICVYADYVVHVHNDDCRDENGKVVCHLDEVEVHEHEESCWKEEQILVCGEEEIVEAQPGESQNLEPVKGDLICGKEEHAHGDGCYSTTLTYGAEEHAHGEECYDEEGNLICGAEEHSHGEYCYSQEFTCEAEEHAHEDACYEWITPEPAEVPRAEGHVHTDACYVTEKVLGCGKLELHTHGNECYAAESFDEDGNLIEGSLAVCGLLQLEEHVHGEGCFEVVELTAEEVAALNAGATLHIHEESCYDEENNLVCGHEATHLHGKECYDETGRLICEFAGNHVHSKECYDEENNLVCGYEILSHVHGKECYDEENRLICGYEAASHVHEESCYDVDGNLQCGYETASHLHEDGCYDEEGNLICGYETARHLHEDSCYDEEGNLICGYETARHVHMRNCYDEEGNLICGYESDGYDVELTTEVDGITITLYGPAYSFEEGKEYSIQAEVVKDEEVLATVEEAVAALEEQLAESAGLTTDEETKTAGEESAEMTEEPDTAAEEPAETAEEADTTEEDSAEVPEEADTMEESAEGTEETQEDAAEPAEESEEADLTGEESSEESIETVKQVDSYQAFDIKLFADGEEVQPLGPVAVKFSGQEIAQSVEDEATDVMVIHVDENTGEMTDMEAVATEESDLVIETDHFSVYVYVNLTETDIFGKITVTVEHWGEGITTIDGTAVATGADNAFQTGANPYVKTKKQNCEIYSTDTIEIPNEYYAGVEKLSKLCNADKMHYTLSKIWVSENQSNKGKATWTAKTYTEYKVGDNEEIKLTKNSLIRFWYTPKTAENQLPTNANFYDYDTTAGAANVEMYGSAKTKGTFRLRATPIGGSDLGTPAACWAPILEVPEMQSDGYYWYKINCNGTVGYMRSDGLTAVEETYANQSYVKAQEKGINASGNFSSTSTTNRMGVGMQASGNLSSWATTATNSDGKYLNAHSGSQNGVVKGLVGSTLVNGELQYNNTVPKTGFFAPGIGSTAYIGIYQVRFKQDGDTYTLQNVYNTQKNKNVTEDLTVFHRYNSFDTTPAYPSGLPSSGTWGTPVYSNDFWPMDDVHGADPHMGDYLKQYRFLYDNGSELQKKDGPNPSDDSKAHNWHFGMTFQVDFTIGDYTGPMEYYFRGDDDFWLFIDGQLAVDIGGIHSSAGETLDLKTWMKNKGMLSDKNQKHTMKVFYMERGGFGSCCYMQFTLPNSEPVTIPTPETTSYTVTKDWDDHDSPFRPESITVELIQISTTEGEKPTNVTVVLSKENNWTKTWWGLPKVSGSNQKQYEYSYKVREINMPEGYEFVFDEESGKWINRLKSSRKTSVEVQKDWINDDVVSDTYRPKEVRVQLYYQKEGEAPLPYVDKKDNPRIAILNEGNGWKAEFKDLPKYYYKEGEIIGTEVVYSIRELDKEGKPIESGKESGWYITSNGAKYEVTYSENKPDTSNSTIDSTTDSTVDSTTDSTVDQAISSSTSFTITNRLPAQYKIVKMGKKEEESTKDVIAGAKFELVLESYLDGIVPSEGVTYTGVSGSDGIITWKKGDAEVDNIPPGNYKLSETEAPSGCLKSDDVWDITFNKEGIPSSVKKNGVDVPAESSVIGDENDKYVEITLTFYNELFYQLPETGGAGTILYTMAGAIVVLCGAGLLYRKKFRERRV